MKSFYKSIFTPGTTDAFWWVLALLIIFNIVVNNYFPAYINLMSSIFISFFFIFSVYISLRMCFFIKDNLDWGKIVHKNITMIAFQILLPTPFIFYFYRNLPLKESIVYYIFIFFLVYTLFSLIDNFKINLIKFLKSFKSYDFNYVSRIVLYFLIAGMLPAIICIFLEKVLYKNWLIPNLLAILLIVMMFFLLYFLYNYLHNIYRFRNGLQYNNYESILLKILTFYEYKRNSLIDQSLLFLSYFFPSLNVAYINLLLKTNKKDLYEYLLDNFYNELSFQEYSEKLTEILKDYPRVAKDFNLDLLFEKIDILRQERFKNYLVETYDFSYALWLKRNDRQDHYEYKFAMSNKMNLRGINSFTNKITNFIDKEIVLPNKQKEIILETKFIPFLNNQITELQNAFFLKFFKKINIILLLAVPSWLTLLISSIVWSSGYLKERGIDIFGYVLRYIWSTDKITELNKIFIELQKNDSVKTLIHFLWSDNWNQAVNFLLEYVAYWFFVFVSLLMIWSACLWIYIFLELKLKRLNFIKNYIDFSIHRT